MDRTDPDYAPLDFVAARQRMVDAQIRPSQVGNATIIAAMRTVPRERAVPDALRAFAYSDQNLPLGEGRYLTEPRVTGRMLQVADLRHGERVLVVAAGTGYLASLLGAMALELHVTALESDPRLATMGKALCAACAPGVQWCDGPLVKGAPASAPYDLIFIDGAVRAVPQAIVEQLAQGGRIIAPIAPASGVTSVSRIAATAQGSAVQPLFEAAVPVLPELAPAPAFVF
ncbi:protein-L-isoaspartate O-methyltransferase [Komagataeibacter xylinus]|uniref:Protein-L-isoaspartate O-methyltransferase n=1 Tax=Komagataeibacter xylinus TaxID=28448 RepID=A0A318PNX7_KOMXY|nr:protein-L-isoaspartate O-methyltransferase [Komagataeibacter xylinus]AZV39888.1 protein-L-isoaspartate O-methyltransferase [Komagataeibacter xylinus]PYD57919.1 protein-L-isoaspartate O-methyltransferase [Komagataeibacter xylinus]GBQ73728.1 protein-L-isoaspartate O-methyltransferase [Komagataeibacter xylinus NBRC 15237]